jgi:hypothetical protein
MSCSGRLLAPLNGFFVGGFSVVKSFVAAFRSDLTHTTSITSQVADGRVGVTSRKVLSFSCQEPRVPVFRKGVLSREIRGGRF